MTDDEIAAKGYAHPEVLVTTEWAAAHLNDGPQITSPALLSDQPRAAARDSGPPSEGFASSLNTEIEEGIALCRSVLGRYGVLDDPSWSDRPMVGLLPAVAVPQPHTATTATPSAAATAQAAQVRQEVRNGTLLRAHGLPFRNPWHDFARWARHVVARARIPPGRIGRP